MMRGLSLEGGGARGSYQAGAAKAFKEKGIDFQGVVGTSIGAINGALIAQGQIDELIEIWENISPEKVFNLDEKEYEELIKLDLDLENVANKVKKVADIVRDGGLDITMAQKILDKYIKEEKIRERKIDFGVVTFSLTEMKPIEIFIDEIPEGELKNYLLASSALPYFKLDKINGIKYLDGAVYNVLPTDLLIKKGYKDIWEVRLNSFGRKKTLGNGESGLKVKSIIPNESLSNYLDFSNKTAKKQLALGYYDALKKIDGLSGKIYYLKPVNNDIFFVDFLKEMPTELIRELTISLNLNHPPNLRTLFEIIIPRISELLDLDEKSSYEEIVTSFLEIQAMELGLERFKIYDFNELWEKVMQLSKEYTEKENEDNKVIEFFLKNELLANVARERSIRLLARIVIREMGDWHGQKDRLEKDPIRG